MEATLVGGPFNKQIHLLQDDAPELQLQDEQGKMHTYKKQAWFTTTVNIEGQMHTQTFFRHSEMEVTEFNEKLQARFNTGG